MSISLKILSGRRTGRGVGISCNFLRIDKSKTPSLL